MENSKRWQQLLYLLVCVTILEFGLTDTEGTEEETIRLLDVAMNFIDRARDMHPACMEHATGPNVWNCERRRESLSLLEVATNLISEAKTEYPTCSVSERSKCHDKPIDCYEILQSGKKKSGVYTIWPSSRISFRKPIHVYCDMVTDGGGWTVIQRRGNFSNLPNYFYKTWQNYKVGFGNLRKDFWLGNDNIFTISNQAPYSIRFDLEDAEGKTAYAQYQTFWIEDENNQYTLHITGLYSGTAGDAMSRHDTMKFTTKDRDNDSWGEVNCAVDRQGAWWYKNCTNANLNGMYQPGVNHLMGIQWNKWRFDISLAGTEIKLRPQ